MMRLTSVSVIACRVALLLVGCVFFACGGSSSQHLKTIPFKHKSLMTFWTTEDAKRDCPLDAEHCVLGVNALEVWDNDNEEGTQLKRIDADVIARDGRDASKKAYKALQDILATPTFDAPKAVEAALPLFNVCLEQQCEVVSETTPAFKLPWWHNSRTFSILETQESGVARKHLLTLTLAEAASKDEPSKKDPKGTVYLLLSATTMPKSLVKTCLAQRQTRLAKGDIEPVPKPVGTMETWPFERDCYHRVLPDAAERKTETAQRYRTWAHFLELEATAYP